MPRMKMRNVSTTYQEKYQTDDGNVTVTNFKPRMWQVHPRGKAPFTVGSKQEAFKQAIGIATRHWGLPKAEVFPPRKSAAKAAPRAHATKKSSAQLEREIAEALSPRQSRQRKRSHATAKSDSSPRILKISRGKTFAGQRSITAEVQYPGENPSRVEFVGPSIGGPGPVVMISRPSGHQTFVTDPSRFGNFGPDWVWRFFKTA